MPTVDRVVEDAPALEEFRRRVEKNPGDLQAIRTLAWELYGRAHDPEALAVLEGAVGKFPGDAELHYAMGLVLKRMGQRERARQSFGQALAHIDSVTHSIRADMLRKLATGHVNQLDHGSWDIPSS